MRAVVAAAAVLRFKMSSLSGGGGGFKKMILMEEAERERLQQKQLREYDPLLSALARAQSHIDGILAAHDLTDEQKLSLFEIARQKFKKLKAAHGPIESIEPVQVALNAVPAPQPLPAQAVTSVGVADAAAGAAPTNSTASIDSLKLSIDPSYHSDFDTLLERMAFFPKVLKPGSDGSLVFKGRAVPGSNYSEILKTLFTSYQTTSEQAPPPSVKGMDEFLKGLKGMKLRKKMFTSPLLRTHLFPSSTSLSSSKLKFEPTVIHSSPLARPSSSSPTPPPPPPPPALPRISLAAKSIIGKRKHVSQKGKGRKGMGLKCRSKPPPGKKPHILYLYH